MPSRWLREGIIASDRIERLDWAAEVFYRRLMSKVDDYGLFDARPTILRTALYPLRVDRVREADIARWIAMCETAGVIVLYEHGGKPYGQMLDTGWPTRTEPKQPLPPWGKGQRLKTTENSCQQLPTTVSSRDAGPRARARDDIDIDNEVDIDIAHSRKEFARFWTAYPRKVGKPAAEKAWGKAKIAQAEPLLAALIWQRQLPQWKSDGGQFIPHPATYLSQRRWEDVPPESVGNGAGKPFRPAL